MKAVFRTIAIIAAVIMLVGCSTTYTIRTKDNREFQSDGEPVRTKDGYIKFETKAGKKVLLKEDEVSNISEE